MGLAFDGVGNLWVNYDGTIAELPISVLNGTGAAHVTPPVQLDTDVVGAARGDRLRRAGRPLVRIQRREDSPASPPAQLVGQGPATPSTIITSSDIGSGTAGWFAFYPAPAFTPLAHALP